MAQRQSIRLFAASSLIAWFALLVFPTEGVRGRESPERHRMRKIKHIVFIIKENRTFANYFGTFPGADGATSGMISTGEVVPLGHTPDRTPHDIDHSFQAAVKAINGGLMNQAREHQARGSREGQEGGRGRPEAPVTQAPGSARSTAVNVSGIVKELTDGTVRSVDVAMRRGMAPYRNPSSRGLVNEARDCSED